jgi:diguanylate cyclase (GGDEF)-like protein
MSQDMSQLSNTLSALKQKYRSELPGRLTEVAKAIALGKANPDKANLREQARFVVHKLRGTATSYGFPKIGEAMAVIEEEILHLAIADNASIGSESAWPKIDQALQEALTSLNDADDFSIADSEPLLMPESQSRNVASIMVVDDDEEFLAYIQELGHQKLIAMIPARNSEEALQIAETSHLDAVMLDVMLGSNETSFELANAIRQSSGNANIPIAFISADSSVTSRVAAAKAGATLYLAKPIEPVILEDAVHQLLSLRQLEQIRILVCDDDADLCHHVKLLLESVGMNVQVQNDPSRIMETLQETTPDLLLLDVMMPGVNGLDVCRMLRTSSRFRHLPIIFITSQTSLDARVAAFESGADDYLPKPFAKQELISRVQVRVERAHLLKDRMDKDALTGLWLRRAFVERLTIMLATAKRLHFPVTFGIIDVDHFKQINDTYGHLAGDSVLAGFSGLISQRFRIVDIRGRWGGDEFVVAFQKADHKQMHQAMAKFVSEFHQIPFESEKGEQFHASCTVGLASFPEDGESMHELLTQADRRLYLAKENGRNCVVSEDPA